MRNTAAEPARLDVVAAIVRDGTGRVLLSQRPAHKHQGGRWEFPGGKVEEGETLDAALAREMHEELGLMVRHCRPFMTIEHDYPDLCVRLHFREVLQWEGEPRGREGQPVEWFQPEVLQSLEFPEANRPVTRALFLPDRWAILPASHDDWRQVIPRLAARGIGGLYLRDAAQGDVPAMVSLCHESRLLALVRDDAELATISGADGVHYSARAASRLHQRPQHEIVSIACHDADALRHAADVGADMVMLSPVNATNTHPEARPLGWTRFRDLAEGLPLAVYALGGMKPGDLDEARRQGARGVAGIGAFWYWGRRTLVMG